MRIFRSGALVVAALLASSAPSRAQYGAPFGGPGMWTTPELSNGAIGAGAASSASNPSYCEGSGIGRDAGRYQCVQTPPPDARPHR